LIHSISAAVNTVQKISIKFTNVAESKSAEHHVGIGIRITGIGCTGVEADDRRCAAFLRRVWEIILSHTPAQIHTFYQQFICKFQIKFNSSNRVHHGGPAV